MSERHRSGHVDRRNSMDAPEQTPLEEIERRVQIRAKNLAVDPSDAGVSSVLARLVQEEVRTWNDDHLAGTRPHALTDPEVVESPNSTSSVNSVLPTKFVRIE